MLQLVGVQGGVSSAAQVSADAHEAAVWRSIEVGHTPEAKEAVRRLRRAAQRALRRDPGGVRNFKVFASAAALKPWMSAEAAELDLELRAIAGDEGRLGEVSREVATVVRALASFLALHGRGFPMAEAG